MFKFLPAAAVLQNDMYFEVIACYFVETTQDDSTTLSGHKLKLCYVLKITAALSIVIRAWCSVEKSTMRGCVGTTRGIHSCIPCQIGLTLPMHCGELG